MRFHQSNSRRFSKVKESLLSSEILAALKRKNNVEHMKFVWSLAVGKDVAKISSVYKVENGVMFLNVKDESWITALSPMKVKFLGEINRHLVNQQIKRIEFKKTKTELKEKLQDKTVTDRSRVQVKTATRKINQEDSHLEMIRDEELRQVLQRLSGKFRFTSLAWGLFLATFLSNCTTIQQASGPRFSINLDEAYSVKAIEKRKQRNPSGNFRDPRAYYHFLMADQAQRKFDLAGAVRHYEQMVRHDPNHEEFLIMLARIYLMTGRYDELLEHCQKSLKRFPKNAQLLLIAADVYSAKGDSEKALVYLEKGLNSEKGKLHSSLLAAIIYMQNKDYAQAQKMLVSLTHANPGSPLGYHYLGKMQSLVGKLEEAEKILEHSLTLRPSFKKSRELLAWVLEKQGKYKKAKRQYITLIRVDPENKVYNASLKRVNTSQSAGFAAEIPPRPKDSSVHLKLGIMYFEQNRHGQALEELRLFMAEPGEEKTAVHLLIARIFELYHRYSEAITELEFLVDQQPKSVDYLLQIARMHNLNQNSSATIEVLHRAVQLSPKEDTLHHSLALAYMGENKNDKAIKHIRKAIELNAKKDSYYFELGALLERTGNYQEAINTMKKVLNLNPRHSNAHNFIGYIYALQGENLDRAVHHLEKALSIQPQNGYFLDSLGWVYFKKGEPHKALAEIKKAMIYVEPDPVLYDHLGDVHFTLRNYGEANKAWRISLSLTRKKIRQKKMQGELPDLPKLEDKIEKIRRILNQSL